MLQLIRDRAQGWIAWVIVGMIIVPFALWGINEYFGGGGDVSVAKVNGVDIPQQELQRAYLQQRQRLQEMFGENFRPELFPEERMKQDILQAMIEREVLVQSAGNSGIRVGDEVLAATIRDIPAFQEEGRFSQERYQRALRMQGLSPRGFEQQLRRDLMAEQLRGGITQTEFVSSGEVDRYLADKGQTRKVGLMTLSSKPFEETIQPETAEVERYYEQQRARYRVPEQIRVAYLELNAAELAKAVAVGEEELRQRYDAQLANYRTPEERRARHILIKVDSGADEQAVAAAEATIEELQGKLRDGGSFEELAKEHSQDPGSAKEGGDLGFFGRGVMVPEFEEAAFSLAQGQISEPVRSPFGFHLIRLEAVKGGETKPFEEVQEQILGEIQRERGEQRFYDLADQLANLTYEHPDTLETAASELGLQIQETTAFSRSGGTGFAGHQKVISSAFSDDVLGRRNNSEVIELGTNHLAVLRVVEHIPEAQRPLDEVKDEIVAALKREGGREQAETKAKELLERLLAGEEPAQLAAGQGIEWNVHEVLKRDSREVNPAAVQAAFRAARPKEGGMTAERIALPSGEQVILAVLGVSDGDPAAATEPEREAARNMLQQAAGQAAYESALVGLQSRAKIVQ